MKPGTDGVSNVGSISWAILGSTGFVGTGIVNRLTQDGVKELRKIQAPRIVLDPTAGIADVLDAASKGTETQNLVEDLVRDLTDIDIVINAAGLANPNGKASPELFGANALLPVVVAEACAQAGVRRMLHLSSAAVQGRKPELDETAYVEPFSPYSESKALGEQALESWIQQRAMGASSAEDSVGVVTLRATSVQGPGRGTSAGLSRIAASRLSSVAAPGTQPSAVSSLDGLCDFVLAAGAYPDELPSILLQPWEGGTVRDVLVLSGDGRSPAILPAPLARAAVNVCYATGRFLPQLRGVARRLEVMWFGQRQVPGWAAEHGLVPWAGLNPVRNSDHGAKGHRELSQYLISTLGGQRLGSRSSTDADCGNPRSEA